LAIAAEVPDGTRVAPLSDGLRLWLADTRRYGVALLFATGSAEHVRALQVIAEHRGLRLDHDGLFRGEQLIPCANEAEVYAALDLPFIEPELRLDLNTRFPKVILAQRLTLARAVVSITPWPVPCWATIRLRQPRARWVGGRCGRP